MERTLALGAERMARRAHDPARGRLRKTRACRPIDDWREDVRRAEREETP